MNKLVSSIKRLRSHVESNFNNVKSEAATKQTLILPFLRALGYNPDDLDQVAPEFEVDILGQKKKVDYALIKNKEPFLLIECKSAKSELSQKHVRQLYEYFTATEVRFGILTNGLLYRFYSDLAKAHVMDPTPFMEFNLREDKPEKIVQKLNKFAQPSFDLSSAIEFAKEAKTISSIQRFFSEQFTQTSDEFVEFVLRQVGQSPITKNIKKKYKGIVHDAFREPINRRISKEKWISLDEFSVTGPQDNYDTPDPPLVRFWNGTYKKEKFWKDLLRTTVEFLFRDELLTASDLPYNNGKNFRISTEPKHGDGTEFIKKDARPLFMCSNLATDNVIRCWKKLLEDFGKNPESDVHLEVA